MVYASPAGKIAFVRPNSPYEAEAGENVASVDVASVYADAASGYADVASAAVVAGAVVAPD